MRMIFKRGLTFQEQWRHTCPLPRQLFRAVDTLQTDTILFVRSKFIMSTRPGLHISREDLIFKTELRVAREKKCNTFRCPCMKCHDGRCFNIQVIWEHLQVYKRDPFLMHSMCGGDPEGGYPEEGIWVNSSGETLPVPNVFDDDHMRTEYAEHMDPDHDIQRQLFDAFHEGDTIHEETQHIEEQNSGTDAISNDTDVLDDLYEQATRPVFEGSKVSVILATIVLMNMAVIHGVSNAYVDECMKYLSNVLLPATNKLPVSHYEAKKLISKLGLNYNIIHTCPEGCVLYRGENENLTECPSLGCGKSRFINGSAVIPARVIRHFPLIPRLRRMFRSPAIADLLRFHSDHPNTEEGTMKFVADSPAWKHVHTNIDPSFGHDVRNLRFGMSLDGVNPFTHNSTSHSTWPVLILIYNLPPYLVTKKFFIQLGILVSGKLSPTNENIDVFIRPLIEELQELWSRITAQDFSKPPGERCFTLRGILMWTISDYPGYGLISGLCTHGYKACTVCGPATDARLAKSGNKVDSQKKAKGRKIVYAGSRRWTSRSHPYRRDLQFDGQVDFRPPPMRMSADETCRLGLEREAYLAGGGRKGAKNDPVHEHGVKRCSALNDLPYWTKLLCRHLLDPMHCEKNLCENITKTIWGGKDSIGSKQDMEAMSIRQDLWLQPPRNSKDEFHIPTAPYILSGSERTIVMDIIKKLKTPSNYVGAIHKCLEEGKLRYMKSHDFHVLMHQVLPLALRNVLSEEVRQAVIKVSRVFQRLCAREIKIADRDADLKDAADALCLLEKEFPPTFMDIMSHLMIHLVQELYICGPVHCRWMYPIERYMKTLKEYVRTYARPEASMAEGYAMSETLGYCTEYLQRFQATCRRVWDDKEEQKMNDEMLQGSGWAREMSDQFRAWAHDFVLSNSTDFEEWRKIYTLACEERAACKHAFRREYVHRYGRHSRIPYPETCTALPKFADWLHVEVEKACQQENKPSIDVIEASKLPETKATSYRAMYAHGMHLRVESAEEEKVTCDSGIAASVLCRKRGRSAEEVPYWETMEYVGSIQEILEIDYRSHCCVLLVCSWVPAKLGASNATVVHDKYGFTVANFSNRLALGANSFAFPRQCQQVFFSDDLQRRVSHAGDWKVVCGTEVRGRRVEGLAAKADIDILAPSRDVHFEGLRVPN